MGLHRRKKPLRKYFHLFLKYTLRGKLEKGGPYDKKPNEDKNIFNLEQSITMLSKSINRSLYPLPNYDAVRTIPKGIKFGNSDRFQTQKDFSPRDNKQTTIQEGWNTQREVYKEIESDPEKIF